MAARSDVVACGVLLASAGMHWAAISWIDHRLATPGVVPPREAAVEVALIARVEAPVVTAVPVAEPARAKPRRPAAKPAPAPRPKAITQASAPQAVTAPIATIPLPPDAPQLHASAAAEVAESGDDEHVRARDALAASDSIASGESSAPVASAHPSDPALTVEQANHATRPGSMYGTPLPLPPNGHWRFNVYYGDYENNHQVASLDYAIEHDGSRYRVHTKGRAEGLTALLYSGVLSQASAGRLTQNGLAPERYVEQRGKRPERWAKVDYANNRVAFSGNDAVAMVDGAQDRLSVLVQLGLIARVMPERFVRGASVEIAELGFREIERTRYTSRGEQVLDTEDGPLRALLLERTEPRGERDAKIEVWLGYDQGLIPVRIRLTDAGGRVLDQLIVR